VGWITTSDDAKRSAETRLDQNVSHIPEPTLSPISPLIPAPVFEQVVVYRIVVYENVMCELGRIVVEQVAECFDDLGDGGSEIGVIFRQFLRERDEGIKRPCLLPL
jgi:hypothetical protein